MVHLHVCMTHLCSPNAHLWVRALHDFETVGECMLADSLCEEPEHIPWQVCEGGTAVQYSPIPLLPRSVDFNSLVKQCMSMMQAGAYVGTHTSSSKPSH